MHLPWRRPLFRRPSQIRIRRERRNGFAVTNQGIKAVRYDTSKLNLQVDDEAIEIAPVAPQQHNWIYTEGSMNSRVNLAQLKHLEAGEIAPGGSVSGWVMVARVGTASFHFDGVDVPDFLTVLTHCTVR